jgi:hypothetical protein
LKNIIRYFAIVILGIVALIPGTGIAFANDSDVGNTVYSDLDSNSDNQQILPNIVVQTDGWLIISYGEKVQDKKTVAQRLDAYLTDMVEKPNSSSKIEQNLLSGSSTMSANDQKDWGNSHVEASFVTHCTWTSSPATFYGTSSSYWWGTSPYYLCNIGVDHQLTGTEGEVDIQSVPTGWHNFHAYAISGWWYDELEWYMGTAWGYSGTPFTATYPGSDVAMEQLTESSFEYSGSGRTCYPVEEMYYGY